MRQPDARVAHIQWLHRRTLVAMDNDGWILLAYPNETEARLAFGNEAMVRLDNRVRADGLADEAYPFAVNAKGSPKRSSKAPRPEPPPWERGPVYMPTLLVQTTLVGDGQDQRQEFNLETDLWGRPLSRQNTRS